MTTVEVELRTIRQVFVDAMLDHELENQARDNGGALVSLTDEYRTGLTSTLTRLFDAVIRGRDDDVRAQALRDAGAAYVEKKHMPATMHAVNAYLNRRADKIGARKFVDWRVDAWRNE